MNKHFITSNEFLSFLLCTVPDMSKLPRLLKFMHGLCKFSNNLKRKTANLELDQEISQQLMSSNHSHVTME
jgi:hypothetical protein